MPRQRPLRRQTLLWPHRKGFRWLGIALTEAVLAAARAKNTYLATPYQRLQPRRGHERALGAVNTQSSPPPGTCSPPASCTATQAPTTSRDPERQIKRLITQLARLGQRVPLEAAAA
jgi:hypothetical protein